MDIAIGGSLVGLGWTLVQLEGGTGVTRTADSIEHVWKWYDFVLFGGVFCLCLVVLVRRVLEIVRVRQPEQEEPSLATPTLAASWGADYPSRPEPAGAPLWIGGLTTSLYVLMVIVAKPSVHLHHWFIGFVLCLSTTDSHDVAVWCLRVAGLGLFMHGAAVWGCSAVLA